MPETALPRYETPFVGREAELTALEDLVRRATRIVTLVGAAGTGKTRLAVEFARRNEPDYAADGGVWFCDLAAEHDEADLLAVVADAFAGASETPSVYCT